MGFVYQLAFVLTVVTITSGQYGPLKGQSTRRTTTPFPPGFQSDNELYNGPSSSPVDNSLVSNSFTYKSPDGSFSGSFSSSSTSSPGTSFSSSSTSYPGSSHSTSGIIPSGNSVGQKPAGAIATLDNPWLSGILSQTGGYKPGSPGCGGSSGGGCSGPSSQQTGPVISCVTPGYGCVLKHQCQGGQTSSPGSGVSKMFSKD